jgi:hypothetical protein
MGVGLLVFSTRLGEDPLRAAMEYLGVLRLQFGGPKYLPGVMELRPLIHFIIRNFFAAEVFYLSILLGLLAVIGLVSVKGVFVNRRQRDAVVLQLSCLWALMAVFHNPYDSILMLPVMMCLYSDALLRVSSDGRRSYDRLVLWCLQIALVVAIPGLWWKLTKRFDLSAYDFAGELISHFDRVLVIGLFAFIANRVRLQAREFTSVGRPASKIAVTGA